MHPLPLANEAGIHPRTDCRPRVSTKDHRSASHPPKYGLGTWCGGGQKLSRELTEALSPGRGETGTRVRVRRTQPRRLYAGG